MKYDDASWHYEGDFPDGLPDEAAATHIGMFLAWLLQRGFASGELAEDAATAIERVRQRTLTGAQFLIQELDEKLTDEDLSDEGNAFTVAYYEGRDSDSRYIDDYLDVFDDEVESLYEVPDTWKNYDRVSGAIDARYHAWIAAGRPRFID